MLAFATLCKKRKKYRLISMYGCPHARLCRLDCPRILRLNSRTCSRTYCGCLRTSLRTFYDFLRTSLRTKHIFLRTIIASIYECDFREENHMVVCHFKMIFQIHIIYNNKHEYCHIYIKRLVFYSNFCLFMELFEHISICLYYFL